MGLFDQVLKRSFHTTQPQLESLIKEYAGMGFQKAHITKAWQLCQGNQNTFHDKLIQVSTEENAKQMSLEQLNNSIHDLKSNLQHKEEDLIKQAIQLSLQQSDSLDDLNDVYREQVDRQSGLKNLGNTCYMNVMLQALFACQPFRNLVLQCPTSKGDSAGQVMIMRLQELFAVMSDGNRTYVNPSAFFDAMSKFKPSTLLVKGVQNDYYELWVSFLDAIESGFKEVVGDIEQLKSIFYGRAEENLMYFDGEAEIIKSFETLFGVVNLDSKEGELYKAFRTSQLLTIDEYLPDGGQTTQAKMEVKLLEPPKLLSFYVNRVSYDPKSKKIHKNNGVFQFDEVKIVLDQFYKNPLETTKHNKSVQEKLEKLNQEEIECLLSLKQCGDCDVTKTNKRFEKMIELLRDSQEGLQRQISVDDFQFYDQNSSIHTDMVPPQELIQQLQRYQQVFTKRREILNEKLLGIQREKQKLLSEKQNLYCLTAVIIHEGTAGTPIIESCIEAGHYTCYVLDGAKRWVKCNDRTTQIVSFDEVYKVATGKLGYQRNVSGLVYQEQSWMERSEISKLPAQLGEYVEQQNKTLLRQMDEQTFARFKGCVQSRMNYLRQSNANANVQRGDELTRLLQTLKSLDTFMAQQSATIYNMHLMKQALRIEASDIKSKLKLPLNYEQYEQSFLEKELGNKGKPYHSMLSDYAEMRQAYLNLQAAIKPMAQQLSKAVTKDNYEQQLCLVATTYAGVSKLATEVHIQRLRDKLRQLLSSLLLKGCFLADLLLQMEDQSVGSMISLIHRFTDESLSKQLKEQISNNLKATQERAKATLKPTLITSLSQVSPPSGSEFIDSEVLLPKWLHLLNTELKTWVDFVMLIERTGKVIDQETRLSTEEPLYFAAH